MLMRTLLFSAIVLLLACSDSRAKDERARQCAQAALEADAARGTLRVTMTKHRSLQRQVEALTQEVQQRRAGLEAHRERLDKVRSTEDAKFAPVLEGQLEDFQMKVSEAEGRLEEARALLSNREEDHKDAERAAREAERREEAACGGGDRLAPR